ncbi:MAG: nitrilase, partial [Gammaproteobacteria bacterium]|nr:nitrilase [Gammaproteobacteria bacterium]
YYAAACQTDFPAPSDRDEIGQRTARMAEIIEQTIIGYEPFFDVRLLVFPEFSHAVPIYQTVAELSRRLAVPVPNEHTDVYEKLARKYGCYIQTGSFLEQDPNYPGRVFNTTVLIGPNGILSKYRKVNPWIPWEVHSSPHDVPDYAEEPFPVVDTELGKLGVAICYDWLFPETIRQLAFNGAEVLIRVSAYMDPWGTAEPTDWWTLINRTRALENTAYVVASNQGAAMANYPPFSWPGGSMLVDYDGRVLSQADPGPGEKVVVAPIDIARLRQERARRLGHDMRSHYRAELHSYGRTQMLAPAGDDKIDGESLRQRIASARNKLGSK